MASSGFVQSQLMVSPLKRSPAATRNSTCCSFAVQPTSLGSRRLSLGLHGSEERRRKPVTVAAAVGELSSDSTTYLIAGAAVVALVGTAFPILFSRKDVCPECDGAGFVREAGGILRANAARKDQAQIVCKRCNGLGKLNQIDK